MNQYESAFFKEMLERAGWLEAEGEEKAQFCVVNTCIVTQKAAHQSRQAIRKAIRENPEGSVAAVGCYGQVFPGELEVIWGLDFVAGNVEKGSLVRRISRPDEGDKGNRPVRSSFYPGIPFEFLQVHRFPGRTRAYLKIQDGCESFCSYCIVPYARGPYRSLPIPSVISALEGYATQGFREVVLSGIHLGKYGVDLATGADLNRLLREIGMQGFPMRVRLSSLEPGEVDRELIEMVASREWICRHFHIPLQSGDNTVLERMNRSYRAEDFVRLIRSIHASVPEGAVGVDVMAGFPGESVGAHRNTLALIRELPVSYLHVFPFSPRNGTPAMALKGRHGAQLVKERAFELRKLGKEKWSRFLERSVAKTHEVLVEGWHSEGKGLATGTSDNYLPMFFRAERLEQGRFLPVKAERLSRGKVCGSVVKVRAAG